MRRPTKFLGRDRAQSPPNRTRKEGVRRARKSNLSRLDLTPLPVTQIRRSLQLAAPVAPFRRRGQNHTEAEGHQGIGEREIFMNDIDIAAILDQQRNLSHSVASQMNVAPDISSDDMLFDFLVRAVFPTDHPGAVNAYFNGGQDCAQRFAALCREHLQSQPKTVLEFASGYGRVARHVKHVLPATSWTCSDVHAGAVEFNAGRLGFNSFISPSRPEQWTAERRFDVVFALSFFSHMPDATFAPWLERLLNTVETGGLLIFTTHGAISLRNMKAGGLDARFDENGFYWNANSDQRDINSAEYGTSAVTLSYVERALRTLPEVELIRFQQAFWWGHQDLYVVRKKLSTTPAKPLSDESHRTISRDSKFAPTCSICGGGQFSNHKVIPPELAAQWQLSEAEVAYIDGQQGCACDACGANLRIVALGDAVRRAFGARLPLQAFVSTSEATKLRVLDINGAMAISSALAKLPNYVRGDFPAVDMHALPFGDNSFDLVLHSDTLEHVERPVRALEECRRVLAPDGCLCFTVPIIVGRLTRSRAGLAKSYHGDPSVFPEDFLVHTEFGADAWCFVMEAGFSRVAIDQVGYPAATALTAWCNHPREAAR